MRRLKELNVVAVFFVLAATVFSGCASIVTSGPQVIPIKSSPSDANLRIEDLANGGGVLYEGTTPYTATLDRGAGYFKAAHYRIVIEKDGYETRELDLKGTPSGWYIGGNIVFGGLIGWLIVDPATGSMWKLSPKEINMDLRSQEAIFKNGKGLMIVLKTDIEGLPEEIISRMEPLGTVN